METTVVTNTSRGTRNLGSYEITNLVGQLEHELTGKRVVAYLVPTGGIGDFNKYREQFSKNVDFVSKRLSFEPEPNRKGRRPVITDPNQISANVEKYALIFDDVVPSSHTSYTMPEAVQYVLSNSRELGLTHDFILYTAAKLDYSALPNFAAVRAFPGKWKGFRKFFEKESEHDNIVFDIYFQLMKKNPNILDHLSNIGPSDLDPFWGTTKRLTEWKMNQAKSV